MIIVFLKRICRIAFGVVAGIIFEFFLNSIGALNLFDVDNIPLMGINSFAVTLGIIVGILAILYFANVKPTIGSLYIKRNRKIINWVLIFVETIALHKCLNNKLQLTYVIFTAEFFILLLLLDLISFKYIDYIMQKSEECNLYDESAIVGKEYLTDAQRRAFRQFVSVIDSKRKEDSFNIGFIADWGAGKTSVTDSLIYEFENRDSGDKYFVLKISILELNKVENVINYIQGFFADLFHKYEISYGDNNLLSSLSMMFDTKQFLKITFGFKNKDEYIDIEKERDIFSKQISKLLSVSKRKNVIIIIEDADRTDEKDKVLKLLSEISRINGIISIISLDSTYDRVIKPRKRYSGSNTSIDEGYNHLKDELDKYIHLRIRIEKDATITKQENVTSQLIKQYKNIDLEEKAYIQLSQKKQKVSLFEMLCSSTSVIGELNNRGHDLLIDIFLEKLSSNGETLGGYFGNLVDSYIYNTCEIQRGITSNKWENSAEGIFLLYFDKTKRKFLGYDYLDEFINIGNNNINVINNIYNGTQMLKIYGRRGFRVHDVTDVYLYPMNWNNDNYQPGSINETVSGIVYPCIELLFDTDEQEQIRISIENMDYSQLEAIIHIGIKRCVNQIIVAKTLKDFIDYLRQTLNNYRLFKMQLREAELVKLNYLEYLISEWDGQAVIEGKIEELKELGIPIDYLDISWVSPRSVVDTVLFANYIYPYLGEIQTEELNDNRAYLFKNQKYNCIILSKRDGGIEQSVIIDMKSLEIIKIDDSTLGELKQKDDIIWGRKKSIDGID